MQVVSLSNMKWQKRLEITYLNQNIRTCKNWTWDEHNINKQDKINTELHVFLITHFRREVINLILSSSINFL